jgi:tripartite-type tricarboxylate transporter receptor subunit TctC
MTVSIRICALLAAAVAVAGPVAHADVYPSKPISIIVPYAAGSGTDAMARIVAQELGERLKQTVLIDNRAGANGALGTAALMRADPDGYTLGVGNSGTHGSTPLLLKSVPYDPIRHFAPVGRLGSFVFMLTVNASVPVNTLHDLLAYSKAHPGKLLYAIANANGTAVMELLKSGYGFNVTAVPYRSMPQAVSDLIVGRVSILVVDRAPILPHLQSNAVRPLMLTSAERSRLQPDVPSAREAGTDIDLVSWVALFAPAGTPNNVIDRLSIELRKVVEDPRVRERLITAGFETKAGGHDDVAEMLKADTARWKKIIADAGLTPQ